jgi:hypothetical protein
MTNIEFVEKLASISPRIKDIKLTEELQEATGYIEGKSWTQVETSGRWKVEFIVDRKEENEKVITNPIENKVLKALDVKDATIIRVTHENEIKESESNDGWAKHEPTGKKTLIIEYKGE